MVEMAFDSHLGIVGNWVLYIWAIFLMIIWLEFNWKGIIGAKRKWETPTARVKKVDNGYISIGHYWLRRSQKIIAFDDQIRRLIEMFLVSFRMEIIWNCWFPLNVRCVINLLTCNQPNIIHNSIVLNLFSIHFFFLHLNEFDSVAIYLFLSVFILGYYVPVPHVSFFFCSGTLWSLIKFYLLIFRYSPSR